MSALSGLTLVQIPYKLPCWRDAVRCTMGVQGFFQATPGQVQHAQGALEHVCWKDINPLAGDCQLLPYFSLPKACVSFVCVFISNKQKILFNSKTVFCSPCKRIWMRVEVHSSGRNVLHFAERGIK